MLYQIYIKSVLREARSRLPLPSRMPDIPTRGSGFYSSE
jgi:hypothetical protein